MSPDRSARPDGLDDVHQDIANEVLGDLHGHARAAQNIADTASNPTISGYFAERARVWTQLADDVAAGRLAELDAIEAAADAGHAIDVSAAVRHPNDTTNGAAQ